MQTLAIVLRFPGVAGEIPSHGNMVDIRYSEELFLDCYDKTKVDQHLP